MRRPGAGRLDGSVLVVAGNAEQPGGAAFRIKLIGAKSWSFSSDILFGEFVGELPLPTASSNPSPLPPHPYRHRCPGYLCGGQRCFRYPGPENSRKILLASGNLSWDNSSEVVCVCN